MSLGKLETELSMKAIVEESECHQMDFLPIKPAGVLRMCSLEFHHRDPFDRMIVARALNKNLTIVTKERWCNAYGVKRIWPR